MAFVTLRRRAAAPVAQLKPLQRASVISFTQAYMVKGMEERDMSAKNKPDSNSPSLAAHMDKLLDDALKQTFPASDALAIVVPRRRLRRNPEGQTMTITFKIGDHVTWNSEAGHVRGRIVKVHTRNVNYKGYVHHASKDAPQYAIKSDKTDHIALHKGTALKLIRG